MPSSKSRMEITESLPRARSFLRDHMVDYLFAAGIFGLPATCFAKIAQKKVVYCY